jgi:hypothetical protein
VQGYEAQKALLKPKTSIEEDLGIGGGETKLPYKDEMEQAFGTDLSHVKAHVSKEATEALNAEAFAVGSQVVFEQHTPPKETVAHEVAHVVQQNEGISGESLGGRLVSELEEEADAAAQAIVSGRTVPALHQASQHRQPRVTVAKALRYTPLFKLKDSVSLDDLLPRQGTDSIAHRRDLPDLKTAIEANNQRWRGEQREEILRFLRGNTLGSQSFGRGFTVSDIERIVQIQLAAGLQPDGIIGNQTIATLLNCGLKFSKKASTPDDPKAVRLVFYPGELENLQKWSEEVKAHRYDWRDVNVPEGEGRLYVEVDSRVVGSYKARGGPPFRFKDGTHTAGPTPAGIYDLGPQEHHTSTAWPYSEIPWGSRLDYPNGKKPGYEKVRYQPPGSNKWVRAELLTKWDIYQRAGGFSDVYKLNDFGEWAWNLTRKGSQTPFYVHTTPEDEEASEIGADLELSPSHGCIHIDPKDRDEMIERAYLREGVKLVVKKYSDHLLPEKIRKMLNPDLNDE